MSSRCSPGACTAPWSASRRTGCPTTCRSSCCRLRSAAIARSDRSSRRLLPEQRRQAGQGGEPRPSGPREGPSVQATNAPLLRGSDFVFGLLDDYGWVYPGRIVGLDLSPVERGDPVRREDAEGAVDHVRVVDEAEGEDTIDRDGGREALESEQHRVVGAGGEGA